MMRLNERSTLKILLLLLLAENIGDSLQEAVALAQLTGLFGRDGRGFGEIFFVFGFDFDWFLDLWLGNLSEFSQR